MKRWLCLCAGLGLTGLAWAAEPPAPAVATKPDHTPNPAETVPEAEQGEGLSLTIYNQDFVVVKERRKMDLTQGRSAVRFPDVAATIVPESVQFSTLGDPTLARVVEQDYEFDLVSADKLLDKYIDRDVRLVARDGETLTGRLLSFDDQQLVLRTDHGIDLVPRGQNIKDVQFSSLPGGLLTRPTLVWQLDSHQAGPQLVKVAYRADHMNWHVDYRARINEAGDKLDLAGWVTVSNNTGTTFQDAQLKLMAGDVHVVQEGRPEAGEIYRRAGAAPVAAKPQFAEKSFAEYHLYELGRKATVRERETKQIQLIDVAGIPVTREYAVPPSADQVAVLLEFKNSEKITPGLGIPLPKGPIRVFQRDHDGDLEFAGTDTLDHTPKDETVRVRLGAAFDLVAERKQTAVRSGGTWNETDWEIHLRNHKTDPVTIDVIENINGRSNWSMVRQSHSFAQRDVDTLVFPIALKANSEAVLTYTIRYNW